MSYMGKTATAASLIAATVFLQSFSFLAIKFATLSHGFNTWLYLGIAFAMILGRAWLWQIVLQFISLSKAYPFSSLVQVLIFVYAVLFFHESITIYHLLGLALMLWGLFMITKSR